MFNISKKEMRKIIYWGILLGLFGLNLLPSISQVKNLFYDFERDSHLQMPITSLELNGSISNVEISDNGLWVAYSKTADNGTVSFSIMNLETFNETSYSPNETIRTYGFSPNSLYFVISLETRIGIVDFVSSMNISYFNYSSSVDDITNLQITNNGKIIAIQQENNYDMKSSLLYYNEFHSNWTIKHFELFETSIVVETEGFKYLIENSTGLYVFEKNGTDFNKIFNFLEENFFDDDHNYHFICNETVLFTQLPLNPIINISDNTFFKMDYTWIIEENEILDEKSLEDCLLGQRDSYIAYVLYVNYEEDYSQKSYFNITFDFYPISPENIDKEEFISQSHLIKKINIPRFCRTQFDFDNDVALCLCSRSASVPSFGISMPVIELETYLYTINLTTGEKIWHIPDMKEENDIFITLGNVANESRCFSFDEEQAKLEIFTLNEYGNENYKASKYYGWKSGFIYRFIALSCVIILSGLNSRIISKEKKDKTSRINEINQDFKN